MATKPKAVLCDVNGTLFRLDALGARMEQVGLSKNLLPLWFARTLRDGKALAITRHFATFKEVGGFQLKSLILEQRKEEKEKPSQEELETAVATVLGGFDEVQPWPDVRPGIEAIAKAGVKVATMTNGSVEVTKKFLDRSGLSDFVKDVMDIAEVQLWKPHSQVYLHAARKLGLRASEVMLVAVHPWDTHGAKAAGLQTAFINRNGEEYPPYFLQPDVNVPSFEALAKLL
ncbi:probable haloacetate dehalogenase H-2 [Coccomyxa sp. Obi]|nr:probable haloacetate dehalogenase H-2 [Coccomyxa sp. Obi]